MFQGKTSQAVLPFQLQPLGDFLCRAGNRRPPIGTGDGEFDHQPGTHILGSIGYVFDKLDRVPCLDGFKVVGE